MEQLPPHEEEETPDVYLPEQTTNPPQEMEMQTDVQESPVTPVPEETTRYGRRLHNPKWLEDYVHQLIREHCAEDSDSRCMCW